MTYCNHVKTQMLFKYFLRFISFSFHFLFFFFVLCHLVCSKSFQYTKYMEFVSFLFLVGADALTKLFNASHWIIVQRKISNRIISLFFFSHFRFHFRFFVGVSRCFVLFFVVPHSTLKQRVATSGIKIVHFKSLHSIQIYFKRLLFFFIFFISLVFFLRLMFSSVPFSYSILCFCNPFLFFFLLLLYVMCILRIRCRESFSLWCFVLAWTRFLLPHELLSLPCRFEFSFLKFAMLANERRHSDNSYRTRSVLCVCCKCFRPIVNWMGKKEKRKVKYKRFKCLARLNRMVWLRIVLLYVRRWTMKNATLSMPFDLLVHQICIVCEMVKRVCMNQKCIKPFRNAVISNRSRRFKTKRQRRDAETFTKWGNKKIVFSNENESYAVVRNFRKKPKTINLRPFKYCASRMLSVTHTGLAGDRHEPKFSFPNKIVVRIQSPFKHTVKHIAWIPNRKKKHYSFGTKHFVCERQLFIRRMYGKTHMYRMYDVRCAIDQMKIRWINTIKFALALMELWTICPFDKFDLNWLS